MALTKRDPCCTYIVLALLPALLYCSHAGCLYSLARESDTQQRACFTQTASELVDAGWGLHPQSLRHVCGRNLDAVECTTLSTNRTYCFEKYMEEAVGNEACRQELQSFEEWRIQRETLAVETHMYCNTDVTAVNVDWAKVCMHMIHRLEVPMAEDWTFEEDLRASCQEAVEASCLYTLSGQGRLNSCLSRQNSSKGCNIPGVGGKSCRKSDAETKACKVAVVSTYPPKNCGLATFTAALLARLREHPQLPAGCEIGVIALSDPSDRHVYTDPIVHYDLRVDSAMPSGAMLEAVHFINKAGYSHVLIQQEFGLTPIMWQMVDLARWLDPIIDVFTVVHSPRATPNLEERGLVRAMSEVSRRLIVMSWYGWHSLIAAYGISPDKVVFIPHGVNIAEARGPTRHLASVNVQKDLLTQRALRVRELLSKAGVKDDSQLVLSNGLVNQAKRLDRMVQAFPYVLKNFPNTFFVILGREHPSEPLAGKLMVNLIEQATALGVKDNVIWLDRFVPSEDLMTMFRCTSVYLTTFDESTPTSGTLLMAMANQMPVVSTPYHFAVEVLQDSRGIIIPYADQNSTLLGAALSSLLGSAPLREGMGARAQAFVKTWDWNKVAGQYAALLRGETLTPLSADPFENVPASFATAKWNGSSIALPNGITWNLLFLTPLPAISTGVYALYVDVDIQVNGAINPRGELLGIGITSRHFWVLVNSKVGVDFEWNPNTVGVGRIGKWGLDIDMNDLVVRIRSQNAAIEIRQSSGGLVNLHIDILDRFSSPKGILGEHFYNPLDASQWRMPLNIDTWHQWQVQDSFMLSTQCPGQTWEVHFSDNIRSNILWLPENSLPRNRFDTKLESDALPILFIFDGPFFGSSGIAQVNRRYWLQLTRTFDTIWGQRKFLVMLDPQEPSKSNDLMELGVLETLVYEAHMTQSWEKAALITEPGVLLRNAWPPNFAPPMPGLVYIHQQAFEFEGIPSSWVEPLNKVTREIWVPSVYNKQAFQKSGINQDKIAVLKHGVEFGKFNVSVEPMPVPSSKGFRLLFNGGLLPRKGIDVLLKAYTDAFKASDNVTLIIHSSYGDDFQLKEILALQKDFNVPEILLIQDDLSHFEMVTLYKASHVYVSPYRSEGFGLTVLEAMAIGLQVIITDFGPSAEICPTDVAACLLVDAEPSKCLIQPCGNMSLFGQPTEQQPSWSEPRVKSLTWRMQEVYRDWRVGNKAAAAIKGRIMSHAKQMSWFDVGTTMINRILTLLEIHKSFTAIENNLK